MGTKNTSSIFGVLRSTARIVVSDTLTAYTGNTADIPTGEQEAGQTLASRDKAHYRLPDKHVLSFVARVQVKVWCFWVTVWREACTTDDEATRYAVNARANAVYNALTR